MLVNSIIDAKQLVEINPKLLRIMLLFLETVDPKNCRRLSPFAVFVPAQSRIQLPAISMNRHELQRDSHQMIEIPNKGMNRQKAQILLQW